ncbi:MAG: hypothetical protein FJ242_09290 [Nitrospira sp.]|nr:hypothetical protein [Nitrospira sp.]
MKSRAFMTIIIFAVTLWGCASTGMVSSIISPTVSLDNFKTLSINVQTKVEDSEKEVQAFKEILITELKKKNKWEVVESSSQSQLELLATITNLNKVTTAGRLLVGAFD